MLNKKIKPLSIKNKKITLTIKIILGVFFACFLFIIVANALIGFVFATLANAATEPKDGKAGYWKQSELRVNANTTVDVWANEGLQFASDKKTPSFNTVQNIKHASEKALNPKSTASDVYKISKMVHFDANLLPLGGTTNKISGYTIKSTTKDIQHNNDWVFLIHGAWGSWSTSLEDASLFLNAGYNVVIWDNQGCLKNKVDSIGYTGSNGHKTTFGIKEAQDTHALIRWFEANTVYGWTSTSAAGVYGVSLGGATAMEYAAKYGDEDYQNSHLKFVFEDSGYETLIKQFKFLAVSQYHIPTFLALPGIALWLMATAGYNPYDVNPGVQLANVKDVPVLFAQSKDDNYVSYKLNYHYCLNDFMKSASYKKNHEDLSYSEKDAANPQTNVIQDNYIYGGAHADQVIWNNKNKGLYYNWLFISGGKGNKGLINYWFNK